MEDLSKDVITIYSRELAQIQHENLPKTIHKLIISHDEETRYLLGSAEFIFLHEIVSIHNVKVLEFKSQNLSSVKHLLLDLQQKIQELIFTDNLGIYNILYYYYSNSKTLRKISFSDEICVFDLSVLLFALQKII